MSKEPIKPQPRPARFRLSRNFEATVEREYVALYQDWDWLFLNEASLRDLVNLLSRLDLNKDLPALSPGGHFAILPSERPERLLLAGLLFQSQKNEPYPNICLEFWEIAALAAGLRVIAQEFADRHRWHITGPLFQWAPIEVALGNELAPGGAWNASAKSGPKRKTLALAC